MTVPASSQDSMGLRISIVASLVDPKLF
jgi:hypothetical protein